MQGQQYSQWLCQMATSLVMYHGKPLAGVCTKLRGSEITWIVSGERHNLHKFVLQTRKV